jgi:hypothetical protein
MGLPPSQEEEAAMGAKTFINNTKLSLTVQLFVRKGDNPANLLEVRSLVLAPGQRLNYTYSGDSNPYLNGMGVSVNDPKDAISEFQYVLQRGSTVDDLFNTRNTITISITALSLIIESSNT